MKPGATRYKLAEMLSRETGALFEAHRIVKNSPMRQHHADACVWDAWGTKPVDGGAVRIHVYSWDRMSDCVQNGFDLLTRDQDYEVSAKDKR